MDERGDVRLGIQSRAEVAELTAASAKFDSGAETLEGALTALLNQLAITERAWVGQGGMTFAAVKAKFAGEQRQLYEALKQTAAAIRTSGASYTASDEAARQRLNQVLGEADGGQIATRDLPL